MTARPAAGSNADRPLASLTVLEPQGERRRKQLVEITARVIEREGVDAVRIPHIAELAGVGRTALYRYFPRREDLLAAVSADFDERLAERVGEAEFAAGLLALRDASADASRDGVPPATLRLFEAIWDVLDECGPAGLILRAHTAVHPEEHHPKEHYPDGDREIDLGHRFRDQWIGVGLSDLEATLIGDAANAILTRLHFGAKRGEIEREGAIRLGYRALASLVRGLAPVDAP